MRNPKYKSLSLILVLFCFGTGTLYAQDIIMTNTSTPQLVGEDIRYFYDPGGTATNPGPNNDPNGYFERNIRDTLTMKTEMANSYLTVLFNDFSMGYGDTLYIFDGQNTDATLIGAYNSVRSPEQVNSTGRFLTFVFHSDDIDDYGMLSEGWAAQAYATSLNSSTVLISDYDGSLYSGCNALFYDSGGANGNIAANNEHYDVEFVSPASHIKMEFQSFSINGLMKIYDGAKSDPNKRLIGQFHSSTLDATTGNKPPVLFSSGSTLYVEYIGAAGDVSKSGWAATISCVSELFETPLGTACPQVVISTSDAEAPDVIDHQCGIPTILSAGITATGRYANDYTVSQVTYAPPFEFNAGTLIDANTDDNWITSSGVNLPFTFSFFGKPYTKAYPGANGLISFSPQSGYCSWSTTGCPTHTSTPPFTNAPYNYRNCIYGVYEDIYPGHYINNGAIRYGVMGEYPCRTFVFNYDNVGLYSCYTQGNNMYNSYQMVIYEGTNIIDVFIRHRACCSSWNSGNGVVGLQNTTSSQMVVAPGRTFATNWTADNEAWRFTPITPLDEDATIEWFENDINTPCVGTTNRLVVNPTTTTRYIAKYHFTNSTGASFDLLDTILVRVNIPEVTLRGTDVCPGKEVSFNPIIQELDTIVPDSYRWNTGDTVRELTFIAQESQDCILTITYNNNCTTTDTAKLVVEELEQPTIHGDDEICQGESVRLTASADTTDYNYIWENGPSGATRLVSPSETTTYVVRGILPNDNDCFKTDTFTINVRPLPEVSFTMSPNEITMEHGYGTLYCNMTCTTDSTWHWNFHDRYDATGSIVHDVANPTHDFTHTGTYPVTLTVTNSQRCTDSTTQYVTVTVPIHFYIPNAFTPNGDALNNIFIPRFEGIEIEKYQMLIYDRQGRLVFKSTDPNIGWDGNDMSGNECPQGVYIYYIRHWTQLDNIAGPGQPQITGNVTLIR